MGGPAQNSVEVGNYSALLVMSLIVLVVLIAVAVVIMRMRGGRGWFGAKVGPGPLRVRACIGLEARKHLYIVDVGGKSLLLGTSEHGIANLGEVAIDTGNAAEQPQPTSFAAMVANALKRGRAGQWGQKDREPAEVVAGSVANENTEVVASAEKASGS